MNTDETLPTGETAATDAPAATETPKTESLIERIEEAAEHAVEKIEAAGEALVEKVEETFGKAKADIAAEGVTVKTDVEKALEGNTPAASDTPTGSSESAA